MTSTLDNVLLCGAFVLYFAVAFVWPSLRVWRQTGRNPYVMPSTDDAYGFVTKGMRMVIASLFAYVVLQLGAPQIDMALGIISSLVHPGARLAGWAGLIAALFWTVAAQYQMGKSWRIGIDTQNKTDLVTSGLFAWSRNPIFLAMRVCLISLVLLRPNAATVAILVAGDLMMQFQVRLEEAFLLEQHGIRYATFCSTVRRWI